MTLSDNKISDISKTSIIPLWARANAVKYIPDNTDEWYLSKQILSMFNTEPFDKLSKSVRESTILDIALRSITIRNMVADHDNNRTVINLGSGLDVKNQTSLKEFSNWINIDTYEMLEFRKKIFGNETTIPSDISEPNFIDLIDTGSPIIIAEGVFMYFDLDLIKKFIAIIRERLPKAAMIFEVGGSWIKYTGHPAFKALDLNCSYIWGVNGRKDIEELFPELRIIKYVKIIDLVKFYNINASKYFKLFPFLSNKIGSHIVKAEFK